MAEVIRPKPIPEKPLSDLIDTYQQLIALQKEGAPQWKEKISVHIDTDLPYFAFTPLSDIHLGHAGVDLEALSEYLAFIRTGMTKTFFAGDIVDNFSPVAIPEGMLGDPMVPQVQLEMMTRLFREYEPHTLGVVNTPSHDGWTRKKTGIDLLALAVKGTEIPLLKNGGVLDLSVNGQRYKIVIFHKIDKYNSSLNRLNAHHRVRELHTEADVVLSAHRHIGAMEKSVHREGKPYFVQLGTTKIDDSYGEVEGMFPRPQVFFPTLFFDTRKHNVEAIEDLEMARNFCEMMEQTRRTVAVASIHNARNAKT